MNMHSYIVAENLFSFQISLSQCHRIDIPQHIKFRGEAAIVDYVKEASLMNSAFHLGNQLKGALI